MTGVRRVDTDFDDVAVTGGSQAGTDSVLCELRCFACILLVTPRIYSDKLCSLQRPAMHGYIACLLVHQPRNSLSLRLNCHQMFSSITSSPIIL